MSLLSTIVREQEPLRQAHGDSFVEVHDEDFILWIARLDKCERRLNNVRLLLPHAAAVVDDQAHCRRNVFRAQELDLLLAIIFEQAEVVFGKPFDRTSFRVEDASVEYDKIDVNGESVVTTFG